MDENTNTTAPENTNDTNNNTTGAGRQRKPAKRTIEELHFITPGKMTEPEKIDYIKALREENTLLVQQNSALEGNAKSAYEQYRILNEKFTDFKLRARGIINFTKQAIDTCRTSIILVKDLED